MSRFGNDALDLDGTVVLGGHTSMSLSLNQSVAAPDSATDYPQVQHVMTVLPEATFTTMAIEDVVSNIGISGACMGEDGLDYGCKLYQARRDPCVTGGRASGSVNLEAAFSDGHVLINSITAAPGSHATAELGIHAVGAVAVTFNKALPTHTAGTNTEGWQLGGVQVAGVGLDGVTNVTINYGVSFEKPVYAGISKYASTFDILKTAPSISISLEDPSVVDASLSGSTFMANGLPCGHANSEIWLLKRDALSTSTVHLKLTFAGLAVVPRAFGASGASASSSDVEVYCIDDGTNAPLVWTTGTAYTAPTIDQV